MPARPAVSDNHSSTTSSPRSAINRSPTCGLTTSAIGSRPIRRGRKAARAVPAPTRSRRRSSGPSTTSESNDTHSNRFATPRRSPTRICRRRARSIHGRGEAEFRRRTQVAPIHRLQSFGIVRLRLGRPRPRSWTLALGKTQDPQMDSQTENDSVSPRSRDVAAFGPRCAAKRVIYWPRLPQLPRSPVDSRRLRNPFCSAQARVLPGYAPSIHGIRHKMATAAIAAAQPRSSSAQCLATRMWQQPRNTTCYLDGQVERIRRACATRSSEVAGPIAPDAQSRRLIRRMKAVVNQLSPASHDIPLNPADGGLPAHPLARS